MATYQHVIWTTRGCWRPDEKRGSWAALGKLYCELQTDNAAVELSRPLPKEWSGSPFLPDFVSLGPKERESVGDAIRYLAREDGDRLAGNTPIHLLSVEPTSVQMVTSCEYGDLAQIVGRLKSRSAREALLNRVWGDPPAMVWGKSFWYSQFCDANVVKRIEGYIQGSAR